MYEDLNKDLIRIEGKIDSVLLGQSCITEKIGYNKGTIDGHAKQLGWIWALMSGGILAALTALLRSIT